MKKNNLDEKLKRLKDKKYKEDEILKKDKELELARKKICDKIWKQKILEDKNFLQKLDKIKKQFDEIKSNNYEDFDWYFDKNHFGENSVNFKINEHNVNLQLSFYLKISIDLMFADDAYAFERNDVIFNEDLESLEEFKESFIDKVLIIFENRNLYE